jgi:hypothetical protein
MWWKCAIGVLIVAFTVREMFHDLFHPSVGGSVSEGIAKTVFWAMPRRPKTLSLAAPLAVFIIILSWAMLMAAGFAFIYWGVPPWVYRLEPGVKAPTSGFGTALYFSLEAMTTLGLGDIKPAVDWFRILVTMHTLIGFALVTASLTWMLLIFPATARTSRVALMAWALAESERRTGLGAVSTGGADMLRQLTEGIIRFRIDLIHYPILYYFRAQRDEACMANGIVIIDAFSQQGREAGQPDGVRFYAEALSVALDRAAELLGSRYREVDKRNRGEVIRAYVFDHAIRGA